jgi:hypothetical protein
MCWPNLRSIYSDYNSCSSFIVKIKAAEIVPSGLLKIL